ncbi:MAG TPA: type II toxin-antitoxin system VapC family toxin [Thermoanaerobaculia bacterium]|jgi:predicted nucleic acid-binding protein|nr:type II toxin-antitoxin system VapC family toxin [Thermoanaerobaculia bacterium]
MKVVDASAVCALVFAEEEERNVAERIAGDPLVAPTLLSYEVANACWKKLRRHPELEPDVLAAYARFARLGVRQLEVNLAAVILLAAATRLSAYDAAYVWLARALGVELVSLDRRLLQAAADG